MVLGVFRQGEIVCMCEGRKIHRANKTLYNVDPKHLIKTQHLKEPKQYISP